MLPYGNHHGLSRLGLGGAVGDVDFVGGDSQDGAVALVEGMEDGHSSPMQLWQ